MRLNAQTDFSLRILMYLASKEQGLATIQEVSSRMGLSQAHMMRVAAKLTSCGFVKSQRGRVGGLRLAKDAKDITVEDVIRAIEPDFSLVQCFGPSDVPCTIEPGCLLKHALSNALEAFFTELRAVTLGELTSQNHNHLIQLFQMTDDVAGARSFGPMNHRKASEIARK